MEPDGIWKLSPAYDLTYSYNPDGLWTATHQMSLSNKVDNFTAKDLLDLGVFAGVSHANKILEEILAVVDKWPVFAEAAGVPEQRMERIRATHRSRSISHSLDMDARP